MGISACLLMVLLAGQPPNTRPPAPPAGKDDPAAAGPLVEVTEQQVKLTPTRLLSAAMTAPVREPLAGRPLGLLEALTRAAVRPRQLEAVHSYWSLVAAVGEYHFARDEYEHFDDLTRRPQVGSTDRTQANLARNQLAMEVSAAAARLREAELKALAAQSELSARLAWPAAEPLPLPLDAPHVGPYQTLFELLFAKRAAPPRLRLLDRTLPLRRESVQVRAEGVQAATDGWEAARDAYQHGETSIDTVAVRLADVGRCRRAFLTAVRDYNHEIAEYSLTMAKETSTPAALLAMLVRTSTPEAAASGASTDTASGGSPPKNGANAAEDTTPLQALPGRRDGPPGVPVRPEATQPQTPPSKPQSPSKSTSDAGEARSVLRDRPAQTPRPSTRYKPPASIALDIFRSSPDSVTSPEPGLYGGLMALSAPKRTHRLATLLHWDRAPDATAGKTIDLADCLAKSVAGPRTRIVATYWRARELTARRQTLSDRHDQLAALQPIALGQASQPAGAEAMLHLRSAQLDAKADLLDAEAMLWNARLELTSALGPPAASDSWLLPSTAPHGGRYDLRLESQPKPVVESPTVKGLAATIPALHATLADRAETIIRTDAGRAAATEAFERGQPACDVVLAAIERQTEETLAFLDTLTRYNRAIAEYALHVLPPTTGAVELTAALVVAKR